MLCLPSFAGGTITELFISEYIEGSSFNKVIEIYNGTGNPVDLGAQNYQIQIYFNGSSSAGNTINLTGTVLDGDVFVVAHDDANTDILAQADQTTSDLSFNGDDAVVLRRNSVVIDVIGIVGSDPGSEWGTGTTSTQDNTLVRKETVCQGDNEPGDPFDPSLEWNGFASNTTTDLGMHTTTCGSGAGAVLANCNSPATTSEGQALIHPVSATDGDGRVVDIQILTISPSPAPGTITLGNLIPATMPGESATAEITISDSVPLGSYSVTLLATNDDPIPESDDCPLIVQISGSLTIAEIQGTPSTQGPDGASPVAGLTVETSGIVTAVKINGFFLQMNPGDGNAQSSDGIFVFTGAAPTVMVGDAAQVTGEVVEFFGYTEFTNSPVVQVLSSGNPLPSPVVLDSQFPDPDQPASQLEPLEGMLVNITDGLITVPGRLSFGIEIFYAVADGRLRNLRETGIDAPGLPNLPVFDTNPEALRIDVSQLTPGVIGYSQPVAGQRVTATGPLEYAFSEYRLLADSSLSISGSTPAQAIPLPNAGEFTVASFNLEFLDAGNTIKTQKASKAILQILNAPDILALQEVVDQAALDALKNQIALDDPSVNYTAVVPADSDGFAQEVAYLIKDTVSNASFSELGLGETYPNAAGNCDPEILHNRPPYVLDATVTPPGGQPYDITVVNLHLRSLSGVDDPVQGDRVRMKRFLIARSLAGHLQTMQMADPSRKILVVGDYNAYPFSDGYVDVAGIIAGQPDFDLIESNTYPELMDPQLLDLGQFLPEGERYSFVFGKNAQQLDQMLATDNFGCDISTLLFGRLNANYPEAPFETDPSRPERCSDHDPAVVYIQTATNPLPGISIKDALVLEGTGAGTTTVSFGVTLCSPSSQMVTVDWSLIPNTALPGQDYVESSGTLTFMPDSVSEQIDIEIIADALKESNEDFFLLLQMPTNAVINDSEGKAQIINDDQPDPLTLGMVQSQLRLEDFWVLKAWPTGGSGSQTYSFQWEDVSPVPAFVFDPDTNPIVLDTLVTLPAAFKVTVLDLLGQQAKGTSVIGDSISLLANSWNKSAPNFEFDSDGLFTVADWTAIINFSPFIDTTYACDAN